MWFVVAGLVFMLLGRKLGWAVSKAVLYPAPLAVSIVTATVWGIGVGASMTWLIGWLQPTPILKWIMGFALGAYVATPNYGLFAESSVPDSQLPRHVMIKTVPLLAYVVTELSTMIVRVPTFRGFGLHYHHGAVEEFKPWVVAAEVTGILFASIFFLRLFLDWISRRHPRWRNTCAFIVAAVSSYAAGFALDLCVSAMAGATPRQNALFPVITWGFVASICYVLAVETTQSDRAIFIPYLVQGGLATFGAVVGHVRNCFVALPLFVVAFVSWKRRDRVHKSYYEYDESTQSFRSPAQNDGALE